MNKLLQSLVLLLLLIVTCPARAQMDDDVTAPIKYDDDSYVLDTTQVVCRDTIIDLSVNTNSWKHNWFFAANVWCQKFIGDYNSYGKFSETLSPEVYLSVGRWATPSFGVGVEAGIGQSHGFTSAEHTTPYTMLGTMYTTSDGQNYYKQKIKWWDAGINIHLNLSRMIMGYEGANRKEMMGQFILGMGVGWIHHYGFENGNPQLNEISGKVDLQYSQFLTKAKRVSLDVKARLTLYQTNFDGNFDYPGCQKWDYNIGMAVGFTFHSKRNIWTKPTPVAYQTVYKTREERKVVEEAPVEKVVKLNNFSFYVMYPDDKTHGINSLVGLNGANTHETLPAIANGGYESAENDKLYSLADVYAAVMRAKGENVSVTGADDAAVNELCKIFANTALTKITVMSTASKMDYRLNDKKQQKKNVDNVDLANSRAKDVISMLKQAPRMNMANPYVMLVNDLDIHKEHCVKVTVQYLSK